MSCTRRFHVPSLSADVGWERTLVDWNGEGGVEDKEIKQRWWKGNPSCADSSDFS